MCEGRVRKGNSMTLTSHPHVVYSCSYLSKHEFRDTLSRDAHIYFSRRNRRVLRNPCYHSWKYHDRNCCGMFGRRTSSLQRQTLCVYVCIWISRTIRGAPVSVSRFETIFFPPRQKKEVEAASKLWLTERASFPRKHNIEDPKILWKQSTNTRASPSLVESFVRG